MKNSAFRFFLPAVVVVLFLSGCSFGLIPASSRDSAATISLKLGSLDATSDSTSRAIVQGGGYLYLRTIGGPTGQSGPFYGPYSVAAGGTFSTTDLPVGTYTGMVIFYSANKLDETKTFSYNGGTYTFRQLMQLSDDILISSSDSPVDGAALLDFFNGEGSYGEIKKEITLTAGSTTPLSATLIPICGGDYFILSGNSNYALPSTPTTVKKFYELYGMGAAKGSTISCTMTPGTSGTATIGTVVFYGADGSPLSSPVNVGTITAAKTLSFTANGESRAYLYIEYQASDLTLSFGGMTSTLKYSFIGNSDWPNKTLYIGVFDSSLASTTVTTTNIGYIGVGVITFDSEGNGSGVVYDYVTGKAMSPLAGHTYVYKAFIDMKNRYASYASATAVLSSGILGSIEPNYGDYTSSGTGLVAGSGDTVLGLAIESFHALDTATLYVASAAKGTGTGLDPLDAYAFADLSNLLTQFSDAAGINIVLMGNVDLTTTLTLSGPSVTLTSFSPTGFTIYYTTTAAYISVNAKQFTMSNVVLDGSQATGLQTSAIVTSSDSNVILSSGTVVQNMSSTSGQTGGAVNVSGVFRMVGSTIKGCSAGYGGGVYLLGSSAEFIMDAGSLITGCTATTGNGGGVMMPAGSMTMESGSSITGCTVTASTSKGGGIYAASGVTKLEFKTGALVTGNSVPSTGSGGGVYDVSGIATGYDSVVTGNFLSDYPSMGSNYFKD